MESSNYEFLLNDFANEIIFSTTLTLSSLEFVLSVGYAVTAASCELMQNTLNAKHFGCWDINDLRSVLS